MKKRAVGSKRSKTPNSQQVIKEETVIEEITSEDERNLDPNKRLSMQEPLLYLDVNFGGTRGVTRIIMYKDDTPEGIADKFCSENELGTEK